MKNIKKFLKGNKGASEVTQSFLLIGVALAYHKVVKYIIVSN